MGTYRRWCVDVNTDDEGLLKAIQSVGRSFDYDQSGIAWDAFCFRKWSTPVKWDPFEIIKKLSKEFPKVIFSVRYYLEDNTAVGKYFVCDGEVLYEKTLFPKPTFPSMSLWKHTLRQYKEDQEDLKKKRIQEALEKEKAAHDKRIAQLEAELSELKEKQNG